MTQDQKIIRNKLGLLKLAQTLGSVSDACKVLGFSRDSFLVMQLIGVLFFAATIPVSAVLAERGRRSTLFENRMEGN